MKSYFTILVLCLCIFSCGDNTKTSVNFSNPLVQQIIVSQDERDTHNLLPFLDNESDSIRERAAMAFASLQDSLALWPLYELLSDKPHVAQAAAFAIGQIRSASSVSHLQNALEAVSNDSTRFELLAALGKTGGVGINSYLKNMYSNGTNSNGISWALCYLSLNHKLNSEGIQLALTIVRDQSDPSIRFGAAFALSRADLDGMQLPVPEILSLYLRDDDDEVKTILAAALSQIGAESITEDLINNVRKSSTKCQISFLKSVSRIESPALSDYAQSVILDGDNINLKIQAVNNLSSFPEHAHNLLRGFDLDSLNWRVRAILFQSAIRHSTDLYPQILELYGKSNNAYEKGMLLAILVGKSDQIEWIQNEIMSQPLITATYGMESYSNAVRKDVYKAEYPFLMDCLWSESDALIFYAAQILRDSSFFTTEVIDTLTARQAKLRMPEKIEAYYAIENTFRYYEGAEPVKVKTDFNHPINPDSISFLGKVKGFRLKTTKGDIVMEAHPWEAPATVLSIVRLVNRGFYNGKLFHRTVPNFLVQTGSTEGDGWGIANQTRRSEFTKLEFSRGAAGIASLGKDTESSQWTIYHSPLPRDNGYYTVFANVTEGMDVVENIEIGDKIIEMKTLYH